MKTFIRRHGNKSKHLKILQDHVPIYYAKYIEPFVGSNVYFLSDRYLELLDQVRNYLQTSKGKIYNKDYKAILKKAKSGDFVFLDPPYIEDHDYQMLEIRKNRTSLRLVV